MVNMECFFDRRRVKEGYWRKATSHQKSLFLYPWRASGWAQDQICFCETIRNNSFPVWAEILSHAKIAHTCTCRKCRWGRKAS